MPSIKFRLEELSNVLKLGKSLSEQSRTDKKSLIFNITEDSADFYFLTSANTIRNSLNVIETDLGGMDEWVFSVKPDELTKLVEAYRNSAITIVDSIEFVLDGDFLNIVVHEVPANDGVDASFEQDSTWRINVTKPIEQDLKRASINFPEESHKVSPLRLNGYLKSLVPLLSKAGNGAANQVTFNNDYVFVKPNQLTAMFQNKLTEDEMESFTLNITSIPSVFEIINIALQDLASMELAEGEDPSEIEEVQIDLGFHYKEVKKKEGTATPNKVASKRPDYIAFQYKGVELFIRNISTTQVKLGRSSKIFDFTEEDGKKVFPLRENGIILDRLYFRSILRRLEVSNRDVTITVDTDENVLRVSTDSDSFSQKVPLYNYKGKVDGISFRVSLNLLSRIVLGDDSVFTKNGSEMFIYFDETNTGYRLYVLDKSNSWATEISVNQKRS